MPSDSKKKREQKKKEAAKKRDVKKPSAACDTASDGDAVARLTDGDNVETVNGDEPEACQAADEGKTLTFLCRPFALFFLSDLSDSFDSLMAVTAL